ncbi:dienelactone hydrolase family-domain-containing protein [Thamnidium elegans]|nr:dienelactone hydrolase family-domain-containing protein [Thamnidium elegans]
MSFSKACCSLPPVQSDYTPQGETENLGDLPVYVVGPKDATKAIFVFYDIYGPTVNTKQTCDILAKNCGWRVVLPDFFRGDYHIVHELGDKDKLTKWWASTASTEVITPDVIRVENYLKEAGVKEAGFVGFCWGGKVSVQLTATLPFFIGAAIIHPSAVDIVDAENAGAPILNLPSKDEPDMVKKNIVYFMTRVN